MSKRENMGCAICIMNLDLISLWTHTLMQEVGSVYTRLDYIGVQLKLQEHKTT